MKLIVWNCQMAFRKKAEFILNEVPDILIIPESESLEKLKFKKEDHHPKSAFWYGDNIHKGIGVYSYSDFTITPLKDHNLDFKYVIPLLIKNKSIEFILLAIWGQKPSNGDNYGAQTWNAIHYYSELLKHKKIILAGDLNSNTFWDKPSRIANHSKIVEKLEGLGIQSTYHVFYNQEQGKELHPTFFLYKDITKPYHLDYCFASNYFMKRLKNVSVGKHKYWTAHSDHSPLIVEFEI